MIRKVLCFLLVFLVFPLLFLSGCAGDHLIIRPDIYVSGNFEPPRWYRQPYYGPFWEYSVLTVMNNTRYELNIIQDGSRKGAISPGQHLRLSIKNYYNESRQVGMIAVAYYGGHFVGVASRTFHFYGNTYIRQSETWVVSNWDIHDP